MSLRCSVVIVVGMAAVVLAAPQYHFNPAKKPGFLQAKSDSAQPEIVTTEPPPPVRVNERNLRKEQNRELEELQAKSAHYEFDTSISDSINDQTVTRHETRQGLSLKGMYAYTDGFYRREVHYIADEKGYRVTKESSVLIGDGPQEDINGSAHVSTSLAGSYSITADDIAKLHTKKVPKRVL